jgi:hypothetical protein
MELLNSNTNIIGKFLSSYNSSYGSDCKCNNMCSFQYQQKTQLEQAHIYFLNKRCNYNVQYKNCDGIIDESSNQNQIKKIEISDPGEIYVYDLETECGRFNAGVGDIQVKNTDSCMISFKYNSDNYEQNRRDTFKYGILCGDLLTKEIFNRPPIEMEFEKVFQPFVLLSKKRYIAKKFDNIKDPLEFKGIDAKGIATTRRNYCKMVKDCYSDIINIITESHNKDDILRSIVVFKDYIQRLHNYSIPIPDLIVTGKLAKSYKKSKPTHAILADKLKERNEEVAVGDRIQYIFIESANPKTPKTELGEDPNYAIRNNLRYNRFCYLDQLSKPIMGFYKVVLNDYPDLLTDLLNFINEFAVKEYHSKPFKRSDFKID